MPLPTHPRTSMLKVEMSCNWQLCSDLCASKHPFFIGLSPVHTNGHRGAEPRLHLTSPHKARSLEPTGGTEIALTHPKPKHVHTYPQKLCISLDFCPEISGRCQLGSLLFTSNCHWGTYIEKSLVPKPRMSRFNDTNTVRLTNFRFFQPYLL